MDETPPPDPLPPADGTTPTRAVVLGGGGVTGIAWELGVLRGLADEGVDLAGADAVIGTSAGAFVGAALAGGRDVAQLFDQQLDPPDVELPAAAAPEVTGGWMRAFASGDGDCVRIARALGELALAHPEPVPWDRRRAVVRSRLAVTEWPAALRVTALDAHTGELVAIHAGWGVALADAVAASGAVPGVWPVERFAGRAWIDGGMVSTANAGLAAGHRTVVVLAPMPDGFGTIPGAVEDVDALRAAGASVALVVPDDACRAAIGPDIFDPARRAAVARAGREQGRHEAAAVAAVWRQGSVRTAARRRA